MNTPVYIEIRLKGTSVSMDLIRSITETKGFVCPTVCVDNGGLVLSGSVLEGTQAAARIAASLCAELGGGYYIEGFSVSEAREKTPDSPPGTPNNTIDPKREKQARAITATAFC